MPTKFRVVFVRRRQVEVDRSSKMEDAEEPSAAAANEESEQAPVSDSSDDYASENEPELSWRLDPTESLSDWTIDIENEDNGSVTSYHVHKAILSVGPRKCSYFKTLICGKGEFSENQSSKSHIKLKDPAAQAFPKFLDYVYNGDADLTAGNAVPLRFLAKYFGNPRLRSEATSFINEDISPELLCGYYRLASTLEDEKVLSKAATVMAKCLGNMKTDSPILEQIKPRFLLAVLSDPSRSPPTSSHSMHLSGVLLSYCKQHKEELDRVMFREITDSDVIPEIHHSYALPWLKFVVEFSKDNQAVEDGLTCLQERCVEALVHKWGFDVAKNDDFKVLPGDILAAIFRKALLKGKEEFDAFREKAQEASSKLRRDQDALKRRSSAENLKLQQRIQSLKRMVQEL